MLSYNSFSIAGNLSNPGSNVFLMIRFRDSEQHEAITRVISSTLAEYSLDLIRADWKYYHDDLWMNVKRCMDTSFYGIAVFEQIHERDYCPNVSLELGYMLAQEKRCLLLKEKRVPMLQSDLLGSLYGEFDSYKIEQTVKAAVISWLRDLGIAKRSDERFLVYVSLGGTCRCAIAKAITRKLLQQNPPGYNLRVESMARAHPSASTASYGARQAIQAMYGEDSLANHHPTMLTPTIVEEADLILVMDQSLLKGLPLEKSYVLKPYFGLEGDVIDPWPDSRDEAAATRYTACALELRKVLAGNIGTIVDALRPRES